MSTHECQQPPIPTQHDSIHHRIAHATTEIRHYKQRLVDLLHDRATASAACADFETALRDAAEMRALIPSSPFVYLCQGDIYRQQGRQTAAMEAYSIGIALSATSSYDNHHLLEELRRNYLAAEHDCSKKIDFVTQLPLDIVSRFVIPMILGDVRLHAQQKCPYLYVSRAWRERIVEIHGGLKFYVGRQVEEIGELESFAPYVGSLEVEFYGSDPDNRNIFQHVEFPSLTRLDVKDCHLENPYELLQALGSNSIRNLTYLRFQHLHGATVRMSQIVSGCPRLEELIIRYAFNVDFSRIPQQPFPSLKVLRIHVARKDIDQKNVVSLLKRLPHLQHLDLVPWIGSPLMTDLQQHCPTLKCLQYASKCYYNPWRDLPMAHSTRPGLQCLQLHDPEGEYYDTKQVDRMLRNNHETLRVLDLCLGNKSKEMNLEFPALHRIVIQSQYRLDSCYGWWVLDHAPNVCDLKVDMYDIHKFPSLLQSLQSVKGLRSLKFHVGDPFPANHDHAMLHRFFEHQIPQLQALDMYADLDLLRNDRWVTCIYSMPQLRHLELRFDEDAGSSLERFMKGLSERCPLLEQLHLRCVSGVTDTAIIYLLRLEMLQAITIPIGGISRIAILDLASLKNLKTLNFIGGDEDDMDTIQLLMDARRAMTVSALHPIHP